MSPKSLLRHPMCVSPLEDFDSKNDTAFREYYDDDSITKAGAKKVKRVLFCTGKVYYDLLQKQQEDKRKDVAIVRIEQLYPFPKNGIDAILKKYEKAERVWVQEEPLNMGAWHYIQSIYTCDGFEVIARKASASPATGFKKIHDQQQATIVEKAFGV